MGTSGENFHLQWNDFKSSVSGAFRQLRQEAEFFDVTLGCQGGKSLPAHKVILSACSSNFKSMLRDAQRTSPSQNPYIFLRGISFPDLSAILDFMYHGEVYVAQEDLNSFLAVAEELQVKGLINEVIGEPSKTKFNSAVKRTVPPSEKVTSPAPAVKKIRRLSQDQGQFKANIKKDPETGPIGSQPVKRLYEVPAFYTDECVDVVDLVDDSDYNDKGEGGDNGADGSMAEDEEGAGGKGVTGLGMSPTKSDRWIDLHDGWRKHVVLRKTVRADVYLLTPFGKRLRSYSDILRWVQANPTETINPVLVNMGCPINDEGKIVITDKIQDFIDNVHKIKGL